MTKIITNPETIDKILNRGTIVEIFPTKEEFRKKLLNGEKLRFYIGVDPTAKALHLGHAQNLMILEDFRKLGHEVIFLIGDFTGMIGDPTDKGAARIRQTRENVENNFKGWLEQVKNILSFEDKNNPVKVKYNSEWLSKLNFEQVVDLASNFTVQQMLERDMFQKRINENKPIHLHEFLYPLMQGYDSVAMDVDAELCGSDQIFNALAGRTLMQKLKNKNKFVIAVKLIADEKTGMLMSKSNGTGVFLDLKPTDLFGAIMSQPDGMIKPLLLGCTRIPINEIEKIMSLENPRDAKARLAKEIITIYHSAQDAEKAEMEFNKIFREKGMPSDLPEIKIIEKSMPFLDLMVKLKLTPSKKEAKRLIESNAVEIDGKTISDWKSIIEIKNGSVIKAGKRKWVKIIF